MGQDAEEGKECLYTHGERERTVCVCVYMYACTHMTNKFYQTLSVKGKADKCKCRT